MTFLLAPVRFGAHSMVRILVMQDKKSVQWMNFGINRCKEDDY